MGVDLTRIVSWPSSLSIKTPTHPSKRNQRPFLRKLHHQFFLIHRTRITRRMLSGNQQRRHEVFAFVVLAQQQPARFPVSRSVEGSDGEETWKAVAWEGYGLEFWNALFGGAFSDNARRLLGGCAEPFTVRVEGWCRWRWRAVRSGKGREGGGVLTAGWSGLGNQSGCGGTRERIGGIKVGRRRLGRIGDE